MNVFHKLGSLIGKITEETPKYSLLKKYQSYEIRKYEHQIVAEVKANGTSGQFNILAGIPNS